MILSSIEKSKYILSLMDFTYLNNEKSKFKIFLEQAMQLEVACLCVSPKHIELAHKQCPEHILATVINFPDSEHSISQIKNELSLAERAQEIDVVFPYNLFLTGNKQLAFDRMQQIIKLIPNSKTIKVIIESGIYNSLDKIIEICEFLIKQDIDFIKTSTGKIQTGATLEAAQTILSVIGNNKIGLKVSGSIKNIEQAQSYLTLAEDHFNNGLPVSPNQFRIGSSKIFN